jgi:hypothetical protein
VRWPKASALDARSWSIGIGGFDGEAWRTNDDQKDVGPHWNDRISSIVVVSGIWEFYWDQQYKGEVMTLPPGGYPFVGGHWNDQISSFR